MHGTHARRAAILTFLSAVAAGCAGHSSVERGLDRAHAGMAASLDGAVTEERHYELDVDGIVDVDLESFAGDVVIRGGRGTKGKALISATVSARHGSDRKDEGKASLADVAVKAEIRRGGDVPALAVRCTTAHDEPWLHDVDVDIDLLTNGTLVAVSGGEAGWSFDAIVTGVSETNPLDGVTTWLVECRMTRSGLRA